MRHVLRVRSCEPPWPRMLPLTLAATFIGEQPIRSAPLCSTSQRLASSKRWVYNQARNTLNLRRALTEGRDPERPKPREGEQREFAESRVTLGSKLKRFHPPRTGSRPRYLEVPSRSL